MYKTIRMEKRRKDLSLAQFKDYWLTKHAGLHRSSLDMAPVQKVVASFSTGEVALGGAEAQFDAMSAVYFNSIEDMRAESATENRSGGTSAPVASDALPDSRSSADNR